MPTFEHLHQFLFSSASGVPMIARKIDGGVPRESFMTCVQNSKSLARSPRFVVLRNVVAGITGEAAPNEIAAINGIGNSEQL